MKLTKTISSLALCTAAVASLSACSPAEFRMYNDQSKSGNTGLGSVPTPTTVCDPFDSSNIVSSTSGLKGSIHYLDVGQPTVSTSADLIASGKRVDADLFLNRLFVPTRLFSTGFAGDDGKAIMTPGQGVLLEWFALDLSSKLKLAPGESAGDYQLALLSDDGSTLNLMNQKGSFEKLIDNEGAHPTKLQCASKVVRMDASTKIAMNLTYFQGPREHIALTLMWRKIDPSLRDPLADVECGQEGNEYFFNVGTATAAATPKTPYNDLLARGWRPLSANNFELQAGSNRCAL